MSTPYTVKSELQKCINRLNKFTGKEDKTLTQAINSVMGYTELEYIQCTGTQYINTEVLTKDTLKCECKFKTTEKKMLFGARESSAKNGLIFGYFSGSNAYIGFGGPTTQKATTIECADGNIHTVILSNTEYKIDGENQVEISRGSFTDQYEIYLGTWNNANTADARRFIGNIYYFKIYDNDTLIREFIPVVDKNGIVCMYDKVNEKFYYNAGTGEFSYEEEE